MSAMSGSLITRMLEAIFPRSEYRVLMLGLDASGRTTALYYMKLCDTVTTIPTIGFNIETIEYKGNSFTAWDVGGCDKIRPLWRHYYQNTQVVIFFIDSNDRERLDEQAKELLDVTAFADELKDTYFIIAANKQDLPNAMRPDEIRSRLKLSQMRSVNHGHEIKVIPCVALRGDGVFELLEEASKGAKLMKEITSNSPQTKDEKVVDENKKEVTEAERLEALLLEWLSREDEDDDLFLQKLEDATLDTWDHRTHLRIAWIYLKRFGRREGLKKIFSGIKSFIERSPRTKRGGNGTTFHETMTYFWVHMVDYAMNSTQNPKGDFKTFLLLNPQLVNGGLFLHYYSKQRMLLDAESRTAVLLPDIRPLPSLLSSVDSNQPVTPLDQRLQPRQPQTDAEFVDAALANSLTGWGHDSKLRLIYVMLRQRKDSSRTKIIDVLQDIEKDNFHMTINYFWLQMVTFHCMQMDNELKNTDKDSASVSFDEFYRRPICQPLRNQILYDKYYSRSLIDSKAAATEFVVPDLKQLPSKL